MSADSKTDTTFSKWEMDIVKFPARHQVTCSMCLRDIELDRNKIPTGFIHTQKGIGVICRHCYHKYDEDDDE